MADSWLIYLLIFAFAALAAQQARSWLAGALRERRRTASRFAGLAAAKVAGPEDARLRRGSTPLDRLAAWAALRRLTIQSGTQLTPIQLGAAFGALATVSALLLPAPDLLPARILAGMAGSGLILLAYLRLKRARRLARFGEQLPDVIDVIVRSLRAGHPLLVSLALVARETPEPAGPEFALVVDEVSYGRSVSDALDNLHDRVGYPELRFLVASASIAHQTGGNLGEILSRLARMLRERFRLQRRARALSAEGRFSGLALSALPLLLFGLISLVSPAYYTDLWASPAAPKILGSAVGLLLLGNLVIFRLVNFKV